MLPNFNKCRVCLFPDVLTKLKSLFRGSGELADILLIVTGVDILTDKNKYNALICESCCNELEKAFDLRQRVREANKYFLKLKEEVKTDDENEIDSDVEIVEVIEEVEASTVIEIDSDAKEKPAAVCCPPRCDNELTNNEEAETFPCDFPFCKKKFRYKFGLQRHKQLHHQKLNGSSSAKTSITKSKPVPQYRCHKCNLKLKRLLHRWNHYQNAVEGIQKFKCKPCNLRFYFRDGRKLHVTNHHRHLVRQETGFREEFQTNEVMEVEDDKAATESVLDASNSTQKVQENEIKDDNSHDGSNHRMAEALSDINNEIKVAKPFQCTLCDKGFYLQFALHQHIMRNHQRPNLIQRNKQPINPLPVNITSQSNHQEPSCSFCSKRIYPILSKNKNVKKFKCLDCNFIFCYKDGLLVRKIKIHEKGKQRATEHSEAPKSHPKPKRETFKVPQVSLNINWLD